MEKKKKKSDDKSAEPILVTAAEAIGQAAGKIASFLGAKPEEAPPTLSKKKPKLPKRNKQRLPRRQKKAQQKAGASGKSRKAGTKHQ